MIGRMGWLERRAKGRKSAVGGTIVPTGYERGRSKAETTGRGAECREVLLATGASESGRRTGYWGEKLAGTAGGGKRGRSTARAPPSFSSSSACPKGVQAGGGPNECWSSRSAIEVTDSRLRRKRQRRITKDTMTIRITRIATDTAEVRTMLSGEDPRFWKKATTEFDLDAAIVAEGVAEAEVVADARSEVGSTASVVGVGAIDVGEVESAEDTMARGVEDTSTAIAVVDGVGV